MAKELEVAVEAAMAAGELLRDRFGAKQTVRYKGERFNHFEKRCRRPGCIHG
jgi:hypothetical protein